MAGKGGKTYTVTEEQMKKLIQTASTTGIEAYKKEHRETEKKKINRLL